MTLDLLILVYILFKMKMFFYIPFNISDSYTVKKSTGSDVAKNHRIRILTTEKKYYVFRIRILFNISTVS